MHGIGIYQYKDGLIYQGYFVQDKKEGYGIYNWSDGRTYKGQWSRGKQHGLGIYRDPKKEKERHGLWEEGKRKKWFEDKQTIDLINSG